MCRKVDGSSTSPRPTDRWSIDGKASLLCCTTDFLVRDYAIRVLHQKFPVLVDGWKWRPVDPHMDHRMCLSYTLPRQCWHQCAWVLLKGPWLVLGELYPEFLTTKHIKHMLYTFKPYSMNFQLLKAHQIGLGTLTPY